MPAAAPYLQRFETERLVAEDWTVLLQDASRGSGLRQALAVALTAEVTRHLPPSLQLSKEAGGLEAWIAARQDEAQVLCLHDRTTHTFVGLILVHEAPAPDGRPELHIGYLLARSGWGRGYASEALAGLVAATRSGAPLRLLAGVDRQNAASVRVLEKAGFAPLPGHAEGDQLVFTLRHDAPAGRTPPSRH